MTVTYLRSAWESWWSNRAQTAWSVLGLVIGSAALVVLLSLAKVPEAVVARQAATLGINPIMLTDGEGAGPHLDIVLAEHIAQHSPSLICVLPMVTMPAAPVKAGRITENLLVEGTSEDYLAPRDWQIRVGRFFTSAEVSTADRVAVVGQWLVGQMFRGQNPVGQQIRVYGQVFRIVGTLEAKGSVMGAELDKRIIIPVTTAQRLTGQTSLSAIHCHTASPELIPQAIAEVEQALTDRFGSEAYDRPFASSTRDEALASIGEMTASIRLLLGAVAAISLVVGGIGIMHLVLLSVIECSSEIVLRRTLGATRLSIATQFILQTVMLGGLGGGVGSALGAMATRQLSLWGQWPSTLAPASIVLAVVSALVVGVASGLHPALRAARHDPARG